MGPSRLQVSSAAYRHTIHLANSYEMQLPERDSRAGGRRAGARRAAAEKGVIPFGSLLTLSVVSALSALVMTEAILGSAVALIDSVVAQMDR